MLATIFLYFFFRFTCTLKMSVDVYLSQCVFVCLSVCLLCFSQLCISPSTNKIKKDIIKLVYCFAFYSNKCLRFFVQILWIYKYWPFFYWWLSQVCTYLVFVFISVTRCMGCGNGQTTHTHTTHGWAGLSYLLLPLRK